MPKAAVAQYTDFQTAINSIRALELSARSQGDLGLEHAARRARRELTTPTSATTPNISRNDP